MHVRISEIKIKNFQSIRRANIHLGSLTAIVGPSSSGKSAFIRAVRLVCENARGSDFISRGQTKCVVSLQLEDGTSVVLEKGKDSSYLLLDPKSGAESRFTKLGGSVPPEVSKALDIDPLLSFSSQYDGPFLLTMSPGEAARALGAASGADLLLEASREAKRQSQALSKSSQRVSKALEEARAKAGTYSGLKTRLEASQRATEAIQVAEQTAVKLSELRSLIDALSSSQERLSELEAKALLEPVVDLRSIEDQYLRYSSLKEAVQELASAEAKHQELETSFKASERAVERLTEDLATALAEAGICPLCGSQTGSTHQNH